jgi:hypothetical protein
LQQEVLGRDSPDQIRPCISIHPQGLGDLGDLSQEGLSRLDLAVRPPRDIQRDDVFVHCLAEPLIEHRVSPRVRKLRRQKHALFLGRDRIHEGNESARQLAFTGRCRRQQPQNRLPLLGEQSSLPVG